ncbi:MAG TPA: FAD-dependent oxidoreductase [Hyphomicrobiaceae bacterium]|nr:FAD-dependent oxidoreductase [Hyphomicrobiaceae bacterium]
MQQPSDHAAGLARAHPGADLPDMSRATRSSTVSSAGGGELRADLCVIGAGSGGLSVAAAAAQLGVSVILIEKGKMGGDCLNTGCVPSKSLIAAARRAHQMRTSGPFGIVPTNPVISYKGVHDHIQGVIAAIAPNDSEERFTGLGVKVIRAEARFASRDTVVAGDQRIKARRFIIATGSSPAIPAIPGLDTVPYLTNETVFDNRTQFDHLIVIGGGPIGLELAQAFLRLGSRVTVLEQMKALGKDDPEMSEVVLKRLRAEGMEIREGALVERISGGTRLIDAHISEGGVPAVVQGSHLLVAAGRAPNVAGLNLEAAGIKYDQRGIQVAKSLATTNSRVFAIGDVVGGPQFTHVANYHAGIVIRRALFRQPATVDNDIIPWATFTEPELAHIGLGEDVARQRGQRVHVYRWPYHENDRAQAERVAEGFIKVVTDTKGRILGASIVGEHASELIQMWSLAVSQKLNIQAMTQWISPYPTFSEINKRAANGYYVTAAAKPLVRKLVGWLRKLG